MLDPDLNPMRMGKHYQRDFSKHPCDFGQFRKSVILVHRIQDCTVHLYHYCISTEFTQLGLYENQLWPIPQTCCLPLSSLLPWLLWFRIITRRNWVLVFLRLKLNLKAAFFPQCADSDSVQKKYLNWISFPKKIIFCLHRRVYYGYRSLERTSEPVFVNYF